MSIRRVLACLVAVAFSALVPLSNGAAAAERLVYGSYIGGDRDESGLATVVDAAGDIYVAGTTTSFNFPTAAAWQASFGGYRDGFLMKLDRTGSVLWSTYYGGDGDDRPSAVAVDAQGRVYLAGTTSSSNLPVIGGLRKGLGLMDDAFVARFTASGQLDYATYFGGTGYETGAGLAVDASGAMYLAGTTFSTDLPVHHPLQRRLNGTSDAFLAKIDASGKLAYATYLGGSLGDQGAALAVDALGNAYVGGVTYSTDFPTVSPFQASAAGATDGFIAKVAANGTSLVYSTYFGGSGLDAVNAIALDAAGRVYITGQTESDDLPVTAGAAQTDCGLASSCFQRPDAFVARFGVTGQLELSTFLGGTSDDVARGIAVDPSGSIAVTGYTYSLDFPLVGATQPTRSAATDAFVTRISATGDVIEFSTYLGGNDYDGGAAIAVDGIGRTYVTGATSSTDFPVTTGAPNGTYPTTDAFLAIFGP